MVQRLILPTRDIVGHLRRKLIPLLDAEYCINAMLEDIVEIAFTTANQEEVHNAVHNLFKDMVVNHELDRQTYHNACFSVCLEFMQRLKFCGLGDAENNPYRFSSMLEDDIVVIRLNP